MKRLVALLLTLMMLCAALPSLAATKTLLEKFKGQFTEQGFKGTVSFSASGEGGKRLSDDIWAWLKSAAPRVSLDVVHSYANRADGQADVKLLVDGQEEGKTTWLYNDSLMAFTSDLLSGYGDAWYSAARHWSGAAFVHAAASDGNVWPPFWRLLLAVEGASPEWKQKASQHFVQFETQIGTWINSYAQLSTVTDNGVTYTQLQCRIPGEDAKKEIQELLNELYANAGLLSLLKEITTEEEAAAYLQPGLRQGLSQLVDKVELAGEVEILRRYDAKGTLVLDRVTLPFAKGQRLTSLVLSVTPVAKGQQWSLVGQGAKGEDFDVTFSQTGEGQYAGAVAAMLPKENGENQKIAFDFALIWDAGKEEYSLTTDRAVQTMKGELTIKPQEGAPFSLALEASLASSSLERSATRLEGTLTWRDMEDASITATLSGRTAAPGEVIRVDSLEHPLRIDQMDAQAQSDLFQQWLQKAASWLMDVSERLLPDALPAAAE